MKKPDYILSISIILMFLVIILIISKLPEQGGGVSIINSTSVCLNNNCFNIKIADTPEERERGLMFVDKMSDNEGMLFIFDEQGIYPFWMKNTLIPLDIIWLDENIKIVFIKKNAQPCKSDPCEVFTSDKPAKYVLEINAGLADKFDLV